jgi:hypothetical protein
MKPVPAEGVTAAHALVQVAIPGACAQGVVSLVPLFESAPLAAIKKQRVTPKLASVVCVFFAVFR